MARIEFYDGTSALAHEAQVSVYNGKLAVRAKESLFTFDAKDVEPTLSTPNGRRFIHLADNMALEFHDNADAERLLDALNAPQLHAMRWFDKHYRSWSFIGSALVVFVGLVASLYIFALPVVANRIAAKLPSDLLDNMSKEALQQMQEGEMLQASKLSPARQKQLLAEFKVLKKPDTSIPFKLHFFSAPDIGPNAFALPSGDVVLLDELVNVTTNDQQTMGVLSHELGHVAHRHSMRGIIQNSIVSFAVAAWLGDYGSTMVNFGASQLFSEKYSRDFEREADQYAIDMMKLNHISPAVLADFFVIMEKRDTDKPKADTTTAAAKKDESTFNIGDLFANHPPTAERIETLRKAAATK